MSDAGEAGKALDRRIPGERRQTVSDPGESPPSTSLAARESKLRQKPAKERWTLGDILDVARAILPFLAIVVLLLYGAYKIKCPPE